MSRFDDDLSPFRDDQVFQALTGPATPDELAGEAEVLAAFRVANASRPRRRFAARVGTSGVVAAAAVVFSGGVAAAYAADWPAPVQATLHEAFGPLGVPAPQHHRHVQAVKAVKVVTPTLPETPESVPATGPRHTAAPTHRPAPQTSSGTPSAMPTASASPTTTTVPILGGTPTSSASPTQSSTQGPTQSPTQGPTSSPTGRLPLPGATFDIVASDSAVAVGDSVTITGTLTDETGAPVVGRQVKLVEHRTGEPGWTQFGESATSATGQVSFTVSQLDHDVRFVLRAGGHVHSTVVRVGVEPIVTEVTAPPASGATETTVTVTVEGAEPGDLVVLDELGRRRATQQAALDASGQAMFTVLVPSKHEARYRVVVRRTQAHLAAAAPFVVSPPEQATS